MALPQLRTNLGIDPAAAQQNALRTQMMRRQNTLAGQKAADYGTNRANALADREYNISRRPVMEATQGLEVLRQLAPGMDINTYVANRDMIKQATGLPDEFLPTLEQIQANATKYGQAPEESFQSLQAAWSGKEQAEPEEPKAPGWSAPREGMDESGNPIVYRVNKETGEPQIIKGVSPKPKRGLKVYDKDTGALLVDTTGGGENAGADLSRRGKGTIEDNLMQVQDSISRLHQMKGGFDRKYLNVGERFEFLKTGWKEKYEGTLIERILGKADPEEVRAAEGYWTFRQDTVSNLNKEIKWLTGAAMNREEVPRLMQEVPNAGLGLFDGDAPSQFEVKLNNSISKANLYLARYVIYLRRGVDPSKIKQMGSKNQLMGDSEVKQIINDYAKALEAQGLNEAEIKRKLKQNFLAI